MYRCAAHHFEDQDLAPLGLHPCVPHWHQPHILLESDLLQTSWIGGDRFLWKIKALPLVMGNHRWRQRHYQANVAHHFVTCSEDPLTLTPSEMFAGQIDVDQEGAKERNEGCEYSLHQHDWCSSKPHQTDSGAVAGLGDDKAANPFALEVLSDGSSAGRGIHRPCKKLAVLVRTGGKFQLYAWDPCIAES